MPRKPRSQAVGRDDDWPDLSSTREWTNSKSKSRAQSRKSKKGNDKNLIVGDVRKDSLDGDSLQNSPISSPQEGKRSLQSGRGRKNSENSVIVDCSVDDTARVAETILTFSDSSTKTKRVRDHRKPPRLQLTSYRSGSTVDGDSLQNSRSPSTREWTNSAASGSSDILPTWGADAEVEGAQGGRSRSASPDMMPGGGDRSNNCSPHRPRNGPLMTPRSVHFANRMMSQKSPAPSLQSISPALVQKASPNNQMQDELARQYMAQSMAQGRPLMTPFTVQQGLPRFQLTGQLPSLSPLQTLPHSSNLLPSSLSQPSPLSSNLPPSLSQRGSPNLPPFLSQPKLRSSNLTGSPCMPGQSSHSHCVKDSMNEFPAATVKSGPPPGTKIVKDEQQISIRKHHGTGRLVPEEVDASIQECIDILSKAGQHVSLERLEAMILEKYQVRQFSQLNLHKKHFGQMPAAIEHSRLLGKINMFVHGFVRARSTCTLYELGECMREFHPDGLEFDKLDLGPLQSLPTVYKYFKFPQDEYIPSVTTLDVLMHLNNYMTKHNKWAEPVELDAFLEYLIAMYQVQSPFSLGVRIGSIALAIQMLKKSTRNLGQIRNQMMEGLQKLCTQDIEKAVSRFRDNILQTGKDSHLELKLHYASLKPLEAVKEIYSKFTVLAAMTDADGPARHKAKMGAFQTSFRSFIKSLEADLLLRQLFHLAVCLSNAEVEENAVEFLVEQSKPKPIPVKGADSDKPKKQKPIQSHLVEKIAEYVTLCLQEGSLLLSHLRRIEEKVVEVFDFGSFDEMGYGAFLYFLLSNSKIKELLNDCGGAMLGSVASAVDKMRYFHPSFSDIKELLCQAKQAGVTQNSQMACTVCEQFCVKDVKTLGHGSIARLCQAASSPGKHMASAYNCYFETALCGRTCPTIHSTQSVGRLGSQSRDKAMAVLTSCPLLEDMAAWSHWGLVFEAEHGNLRDFVARWGGRQTISISGNSQDVISDFMALETQLGKLLKVCSISTADSFKEALTLGDPLLAAGHLASLITASQGVELSPLALLANHLKAKLLDLRAHQGLSLSGASRLSDQHDPKVEFVAAMLIRLPLRISAAVASQVLLDPLSQVVGSAKSKTAIVQACQLPWQKERLEALGILLGIPEWTMSLQDKMTFPLPPMEEVVMDDLFGQLAHGEDLDVRLEEESLGDEDKDEEEDEDDAIDRILFAGRDSPEETPCFLSDVEAGEIEDLDGGIKQDPEEESVVNEEEEGDIAGDEESEGSQLNQEESDYSEVESSLSTSESDGIEAEVSASNDAEEEEWQAPPTREDVCQALVDSIRREEFGVGIELNEEAAKLMQIQQNRQGRSLERLSRDLYSKDIHFVLELIQNADDNPYAPETIPALNFIIDESGVTIQNNELGFEEKNIRALCDVGKSTKSKHQLGYIGQKGIGFKSVFRVTNHPEIHSNGFHICFDVKSGPMGYILPHWIQEPWGDESSWKTQIMLPWTEEIKDQIQTHAARFNDIQPSLLLFLHRLREVTISNKVEGCEMRMSRQDFPTGEIQITHSHGMDWWLVVRKVLDATHISLEAKSYVDVQSTEIALAFPLRDKSSRFSFGARLGQLPVYAFLPLQSYGFRFIVQGDFTVPSSRESVDRDSSWNQWLRSQVPGLFLEAWDSFLNLPDMSAVDAFISYLQFIPLEGEVMDFFSPVTKLIRDQLMVKECMPVVGVSGDKDEILWKTPSKTVMTRSSLVREIISPQLLLHNLGLHYLHWNVLDAVDHGMLQALGVNTISTDHLMQIGQGFSANWDEAGSQGQVEELAKWMACVYCSLDLFKENTQVFSRLGTMRIVPLSDGSLVSLEDTTVFLLTDHQGALQASASNKSKKDPLLALRHDVNMIHSALNSTSDPEVNSQVTKLLCRMDIKQMTPHDVIHSHVLPILHSDAWKEKSKDVLISYMVCAKQVLFDTGEGDLSKLKDVARLVTNHGVKLATEDDVHFPRAYGNEIDLEHTFPMLPWTLVQSAYLPPKASPTEQRSWHMFFSQLGVQDFLCVKRREVCLDQTSLMSSPWASYTDMWQNLSGEIVIQDFVCEEFHALISVNDMPSSILCSLFQLLAKHWDANYKRCMVTSVTSKSGEVLKTNIDTSFAINLKDNPWVPATWWTRQTSDGDGHWTVVREQGRVQPCQLYTRNPNVERLLAHTAKYLDVDVRESSFIHFLQVKNSVEKEAVKEALISWGQRAEDKPDIPAVFSTSKKHIMAVYIYLQDNLLAKEIQDLFIQHPVIFVSQEASTHEVVSGQMMSRQEMWWIDACGLFTKYKDSLEKYNNPLSRFKFMLPFYQGAGELFRMARIDHTHNMLHLAQLLKHVTAVSTLQDEGVLHDVLCLFSAIGLALSKADDKEAGVATHDAQIAIELRGKVKSLLWDCAIFPTKALKLVSLNDQPMIADTKEWEKMFENKQLVHFLQLELPQVGRRQRKGKGEIMASDHINAECIQCFLDLFEDIKSLNSCVVWEEITSLFKPCSRGQQYLHDIVGFVQQFLYFSYPSVYTEFKADNAHQLKDLIFSEVDKLEVKYMLKDRPDISEIRMEVCIIKGNYFYFLAKNIENWSEINKEVARFFSKGNEECSREVRSFLSQAVTILEGKSHESLQDLLSRQRASIDDLPEEEERWEIPLPIIPVPVSPLQIPTSPSEEGIAVYERAHGPADTQTGGPQTLADGEEAGGDAPGLRSWPPRSLADYEPKPGPVTKKAQSKFTAPDAPDFIKASKQIPSNFKFENEPKERRKQDERDARQQDPGVQGVLSTPDGSSSGRKREKDGGPEVQEGRSFSRSVSTNSSRKETADRPISLDDDGDTVKMRDKRKAVTTDISSSEESVSSPPNRQSQEAKADQPRDSDNPANNAKQEDSKEDLEEPKVSEQEEGDVEKQDAKVHRIERTISDQGLVAVPRQYRNGPLEATRDRGRVGQDPKDGQARQWRESLHFTIPIWNEQADCVAYTELTSDISQLKPPHQLEEDAPVKEIGWWGEALVYDYLKRQKLSDSTISDIIWTNAKGESGMPYDLEMIFKTGHDGGEDTHSVYIEVKATRADDKALFEISSSQIEFALNAKERFQIFRVYGAGKESVRLVRIDNIADRMKTKSVQLMMVI